MTKFFFSLLFRLFFMASAYIVFLLFFVPYMHTEIQQTLIEGVPKLSLRSSMPYAKCINLLESAGVIEGMKKSYDHSMNIGHCIRHEAEGYLKILKNG